MVQNKGNQKFQKKHWGSEKKFMKKKGKPLGIPSVVNLTHRSTPAKKNAHTFLEFHSIRSFITDLCFFDSTRS